MAALATAALALGVPASATAHPFGPPLQVELEGVRDIVNVRWTAADDDWLALARHTGALEEVPDRVDGVELTGAERIARSERLTDHVLERVGVTQQGRPCDGEVVHLADDLATEGVILQFRCEEQVYEVDVRIDLLTDVHPAYRTVATSVSGGTPGETLYTAGDPTQTWDLHAAAPAEPGTRPTAAIGGVLLLLLAAGGVLWLGLRPEGTRRDVGPPPEVSARRGGVP